MGDDEARPGVITTTFPPIFAAKYQFDDLQEKKASDKQRILEEEIIDLEAVGEEAKVEEVEKSCGENDV